MDVEPTGVISGGAMVIGSAASPATQVFINGSVSCTYITINATTVSFGSASFVSVASSITSFTTGTGSYSGVYAGGGGHGGSGGTYQIGRAGLAYDSYIYPSLPGSAGSIATAYGGMCP